MLLVFALLASLAGAVEHVHFIEGAGNNLLFRGGSPEVNKVFSYPALVASLQAAAKTSNVSFPPKFQLVLINVENLDTTLDSFTSEDGTNVVSEHSFFANKSNAGLGQFLFWHMLGTKSHPAASVFTGSLPWLASTYAEWGTDRLVERVEELRAMLVTPQQLPQVIYFHCDCGCDRTGQLAGSYMMRYHGSSWDSVVAFNRVVAGRPQTCPTHRQMQWYCVYLNRFLGFNSTGNCLKEHLCTPI